MFCSLKVWTPSFPSYGNGRYLTPLADSFFSVVPHQLWRWDISSLARSFKPDLGAIFGSETPMLLFAAAM